MTSRGTSRRFHFIRQVAAGGFGTVYLAKVMHADGFSRVVAVKLLNAQWSDSEEVTRRIRDEARLLGLLRHRNIVNVFDLTSVDGRTALVMEYLEAVDLRFLSKAMLEQGALIPVRACLELASQVASALDAAYNRPPMPGEKPLRVIHRDIKPSNIMVDEAGLPKVLDFGVAQSEIETREANTQELQFGSVEYMAPERLFFEPETPASDVYSLASTLFETLCLERLGKARGRPERHAAHLADRLSFMRSRTQIRGTTATELELLLKESLDFEHEQRPSAAEFHQRCRALSKLVDDEDLMSWAERELPPIIQAAHSRPQEATPLTNSILTEDSVAFRAAEDLSDANEPPDGVAAMRARDGERAELLRKGALAELVDSTDVAMAPATGSPHGDGRGARGPDSHERTDGVGWDDRTASKTMDEPLPDLTPLPNPSSTGLSSAMDAPEPPMALSTSGEHPVLNPDQDTGPDPDTDTAHDIAALRGVSPSFSSPTMDVEVPPSLSGLEPTSTGEHTVDVLGPNKRKTTLFFLLLGGCLPLVIAAVLGGVFLADFGGIRTQLSQQIEGGSAVESNHLKPATDPVVTDTMSDDATRVGVKFVSKWEGTAKLTVRCTDQTVRGKRKAFIATESSIQCSVTAIHTDRTRKTALVQAAGPGVYDCFVEGVSECQVR